MPSSGEVVVSYARLTCGLIPCTLKLRSSSIYFWIGVLFNFPTKFRSSSIFQRIEVVFHFPKNWGRLSFAKKLRSSSNLGPELRLYSIFQKYWGCLPFSKELRSSSIFQIIEVVFHLPKSWGRLPIGVLIYSCQVTWSRFTEKCWKIYFPGRGVVVGVGGWLD